MRLRLLTSPPALLLLAVLGASFPGIAPASQAAIPASQAVAPASQAVAPASPILPLDEVRVGMIGTGQTVVRGTSPEPFQAEVLGVLEDVFPKHDLIIARLSGLDLERSGVIAGMSGSPVYVDGRVMGAVAYRLVSFGHEAVAGIVPIESMLAVRERADAGAASTALAAARGRAARPGGIGPHSAGSWLDAAAQLLTGTEPTLALAPLASGGAEFRPIATPLAVSGWSPALLDALRPLFDRLGWRATAGGAATAGGTIEPNLSPGGAIGVQLVRGDLAIAATGTITYTDGDRVLAFGHPFLQGGDVDFPMVAAEVVTVLSSSLASSKLTIAGTEILGAVRQDRLAAVMGVVGATPRLLPVAIDLVRPTGAVERLEFEIIDDPIMTPLYLFFGLVSGVQSLDSVYGAGSIEVDARFDLGGGLPPVVLRDLYASDNQAVLGVASRLAGIYSVFQGNDFSVVPVERVEATLALREDRKSATVGRVWLDRSTVRAGEKVNVSVAMRPFRGAEQIETFTFEVPAGTPAGDLTLVVGDARSVASPAALYVDGTYPAQSLEQLLGALGAARPQDRLYMQITRRASGVVLGGNIMQSLPPSVLSVLGSARGRGDVIRLNRTIVHEQERPVGHVVSGSHTITIRVHAR